MDYEKEPPNGYLIMVLTNGKQFLVGNKSGLPFTSLMEANFNVITFIGSGAQSIKILPVSKMPEEAPNYD
jgi:hypothetical protein